MNSGGGWGLAWFVVLYVTAAWFRLYAPSQKQGKTSKYLAFWFIISALASFFFCVLGERLPLLRKVAGTWYQYNSFPVLISTLLVFAAFLSFQIKSKSIQKIICFLAASTFGVYLIHAHADFSRYLWAHLDVSRFLGRVSFPVLQIGVVTLIFIICSLLDWIRMRTVGRIENSDKLKTLANTIERKVGSLYKGFFENDRTKIG